MNKHIKRILLTVGTLFALLGITGTVAYASGYITWRGTDDYHEVLDNLKLIKQSGDDLKHELDNANHSKEELKVIIEQKEQIILTLEKEIEDLKASSGTNDAELEQAVKDMKDLREKTDEMVGELDE